MGMRIIVGVIGVESNITALRVREPPSPRKKKPGQHAPPGRFAF
jgi:hypothetical protein